MNASGTGKWQCLSIFLIRLVPFAINALTKIFASKSLDGENRWALVLSRLSRATFL